MVEPCGDVMVLQVFADRNEDAEELGDLTAMLREELLELDVAAVEAIPQDQPPENAKGVVAAVGGWLAVHLGPAALKTVLNVITEWGMRNQRTVEISLNGNTLKLTGASADVQSRMIEEYFARQPPTT